MKLNNFLIAFLFLISFNVQATEYNPWYKTVSRDFRIIVKNETDYGRAFYFWRGMQPSNWEPASKLKNEIPDTSRFFINANSQITKEITLDNLHGGYKTFLYVATSDFKIRKQIIDDKAGNYVVVATNNDLILYTEQDYNKKIAEEEAQRQYAAKLQKEQADKARQEKEQKDAAQRDLDEQGQDYSESDEVHLSDADISDIEDIVLSEYVIV